MANKIKSFIAALPEDVAARAEKKAAAAGYTLEEWILLLCREACDARRPLFKNSFKKFLTFRAGFERI